METPVSSSRRSAGQREHAGEGESSQSRSARRSFGAVALPEAIFHSADLIAASGWLPRWTLSSRASSVDVCTESGLSTCSWCRGGANSLTAESVDGRPLSALASIKQRWRAGRERRPARVYEKQLGPSREFFELKSWQALQAGPSDLRGDRVRCGHDAGDEVPENRTTLAQLWGSARASIFADRAWLSEAGCCWGTSRARLLQAMGRPGPLHGRAELPPSSELEARSQRRRI